MEKVTEVTYRSKNNVAKMWIFSLLGLFYFAVPFQVNGDTEMCVSFLEGLTVQILPNTPLLLTGLFSIYAIISVISSVFLKEKISSAYLKSVFITGFFGNLIRSAGALVLISSYYRIGPEFLWNDYTGGLMTFELIPMLFFLFFFAMPFMSLLTDFGGLELIGGILKPIFRPLFRLSGKSAVVSLVAYMGSGTTGMIVTDGAHKRGEFTTREANLIVFGFAIVSFPVTFAYPVGLAGLDAQYFPILAGTLIVSTVIVTMLLSRIPPLSKKEDTYIDGTAPAKVDEGNAGGLSLAYESALIKAEQATDFRGMLEDGFKEFLSFTVEVFPLIILIATAALVIGEFTPIFSYIAMPIAPLLNIMGLPEATVAAPAFVTGAADLFLPFIGATAVTSQLTKFVICAVAIMQMYCLSEGATILYKSSMKISWSDIIIVFIIRTAVTLPIALIIGRLAGIA